MYECYCGYFGFCSWGCSSFMSTLKEVLDQHVSEAASELYEKLDRNRVRCYSCGHCCPIADGQAGVCKVRFNRGGTLYVPWGYVGGVQCDPVEKKPFFHAYCGALAYSFGMLGSCWRHLLSTGFPTTQACLARRTNISGRL